MEYTNHKLIENGISSSSSSSQPRKGALRTMPFIIGTHLHFTILVFIYLFDDPFGCFILHEIVVMRCKMLMLWDGC